MPIFSYKGLDKTGKEIKSTINAESVIQAKHKIKLSNIMLIDIKEKKTKTGNSSLSIGSGKVSINDLALMTRQLATLIKAKIQIVEALSALQDQVDNDYLRVVLSELRQDVNEGLSLAKAMAKHKRVFNNVYINMVEAGEASGNLEVVLLKLADFTEAQVKLQNKIKGAMMYPVIMFVVGTLLMSVIFIFIIPKLTKIFISMKMELPLPTKISIFISGFLTNYWYIMIVAIVIAYFAFKKYISTPKGERVWHKVLLRFPVVGDLIRMINVARFCSTLATLMNSGVPILTAMAIVKNLIPNVHMKDAVESARDAISEGKNMAIPLKESGQFPSMVTHMITLGEKSGELENMLGIISENYEDQVDTRIGGLTSVLEPIMIVGLGIAVCFIVFSVIMPMMKLNQVGR
jgi:general secretion pathway protein F